MGAFDLKIAYDSSILADPTVTYTGLKASCGLSSMPLEIFELPLDSAATVNKSQAGAFTLATITFDAVKVGFSPIDLEDVTLADPFGDDLNANGPLRIENGEIDRGSIEVATPEPGGLLLLGSLFGGLLILGRFRTQTN